MEKISNIVVPVDFYENTEKLVEYAAYVGKAFSAQLHLINVVGIYAGDGMFGMPFSRELKAAYEDGAKARMATLLEELQKSCPDSSGTVMLGEPVDEIVAFADEKTADMIIISTHGAKGWEKILLGSVAERVVHRANCPVLFMNPFTMKKR